MNGFNMVGFLVIWCGVAALVFVATLIFGKLGVDQPVAVMTTFLIGIGTALMYREQTKCN